MVGYLLMGQEQRPPKYATDFNNSTGQGMCQVVGYHFVVQVEQSIGYVCMCLSFQAITSELDFLACWYIHT